ncbi:MAG: peptidase [Alphaproteobacteria bacterium]|nr:peptidase [Alphaproteobacteria bacterium]
MQALSKAGRLGSLAVVCALLLAACGGGGGGGSSAPQQPGTPPGGSGPTWTQGVFQPASTFVDRCQVVRTGVDIEGNPFPDRAGSLTQELFWLRSWTNETYLWNTEVVDRNPAGFSNRRDYFAVLRTTAITPSGENKDDFHFSQSTADFLRERNSVARAGYGAEFVFISSSRPRDVRVLFTEPGSPAAQTVSGQPNFVRGTRILRIDGVDLVNGATQAEVDALNNGLFPATAGENHTFEVQDPGAASTRTITLTSANVTPTAVNRTRVIPTASGAVGYMLLNTFNTFASEREIAQAITQLRNANVTDLVLDLRYNGGGLLAVASQLSYMTAGAARTSGRIFERLEFNAAAGNTNPVTGEANTPIPFYTTGLGFSLNNGAALDTLNLARVYVLSTASTCSASESVVNSLRGIDVEVILIGGTTCGKPYGFYPTDNCGETYFTIQFRGVNNKGFGDYADGFTPSNSSSSFAVQTPGCAVADDYTRELGDETEAMLAAALEYRATGVCPSATVRAAPRPDADAVGDLRTTDRSTIQQILRSNRDMRMPQ